MGKWKVEDEIRKNERERRKGGKKEGENSWCKQNYGNISYNKTACDSRDTVGDVR